LANGYALFAIELQKKFVALVYVSAGKSLIQMSKLIDHTPSIINHNIIDNEFKCDQP